MKKSSFVLFIVLLLSIAIVSAAEVDPKVEDELQNKEFVKVMVKLKDKPIPETDDAEIKRSLKGRLSAKATQKALAYEKRNQFLKNKRVMVRKQQEKVLSRIGIDQNKKKQTIQAQAQTKKGFYLGHQYAIINGFSGKIDRQTLEQLKNDPDVESIQYDNIYKIALDVSVPYINGTTTHSLQQNNLNLTGQGETICIVDTGIDYQHSALGNCNISRVVLNGTNESFILESEHPYNDSTFYNFTITKPGYTKIAVHFKNISIESNYDQLKIYDKNGTIIGSFSGTHTDVWSPHGEGDTLFMRWQTDTNTNGYGFFIDQVINGTANTTYNWSNCNKILDGWDFVNSDGDPIDDESHGSHVAGTAASNNETYKGVAPDAKLVAAKVLNASGSGTGSDVAAGIDWCVNRSALFNISVISLSLGTGSVFSSFCDSNGNFALEKSAIDSAVGANIFVPIATANAGSSSGIGSPACLENATPVGSVNTGGESISSFTNRNALVWLMAPGTAITAPRPLASGGGFADKQGTSMATPHVAGAGAILKQFLKAYNGTDPTPQEIERALNNTGLLVDDSGGSGLTYRRINILAAVAYWDNGVPSVSFQNPTSPNNQITTVNWTEINVSVVDDVQSHQCTLEFNGVNESITLTKDGKNATCYKNKSISSQGKFTYKVYANDINNVNNTEERIIIFDTNPPTFDNASNTSSTFKNDDNFTANITLSAGNLSHYIFSTNATGTWQNDSAVNITGSQYIASTTKTINVSAPGNVCWYYWANDTIGVANTSETFCFTVQTTAPTVANVTLSSSDSLNRTNGTLTVSFIASDVDNDSLTNETIWYNNSIAVPSLANLTTIGSGNTTKNQTWIVAVRTYDAVLYSNYTNSSPILIQNTAPELSAIANITVNETETVNITAVATDTDNDNLTYEINDTRFTKTNNIFIWNTNLSDSGTFSFTINVTDQNDTASTSTSVTVLDAPDFDNDGNPDFNDTDDDNDGIADTNDRLTGNVSDITSPLTLKLRINNSENTTKIFNETLPINVTDANNVTILEFDWNFTNATLRINWTIDYVPGNGTIVISNIDTIQFGFTKTVYINKSTSSFNNVCIVDKEVTSITSLSSGCTLANETKVACPGTTGQYNCSVVGNLFKVSGLNNSAVKGITVTTTTEPDDDNGGGGGGGSSGGGGGAALSKAQNSYSKIYIKPLSGLTSTIKPFKNDLPFTEVSFAFAKSLEKVTLTMTASDNATTPIAAEVYRYISITHEGMQDNDAKDVKITFSVEKDWLTAGDYDANTITLYRYTGSWTPLPTTKTDESSLDIFYEATAPGLSLFAITAEPPTKEIVEAVEEEEIIENITGAEGITGEVIAEEPKKSRWRMFKLTKNQIITIVTIFIVLGIIYLVIIQVHKKKEEDKIVKEYYESKAELNKNQRFGKI